MTEKEFEKKYKEDVYLQKEIRDLIINIYGEDNLQKTFKLWVKGYYDTKNAFDVKNSHFKEKFQHYIKKEGIVLPDDFSDFIGWFEDVYPGLSFIEMQRQFQDNNTFIKFHDYTIRTCNNPNWTIQKEIEFLANQKSESIPAPQQEQPIKEKLSDLITHENSIKLVEEIKIQFKNIKGKRLKLLLISLQELNLLPIDRTAKKFHDCCKAEFSWNVASYEAMNNYLYNERIDKEQVGKMKHFISNIIISH